MSRESRILLQMVGTNLRFPTLRPGGLTWITPVSWKAWSEAWSDRTITRARRCVYTNTTSPTRRVTSACSHNWMHDQGTLVGNSGSAPAQLELALATLQSLSYSIARFHDHQAKTLLCPQPVPRTTGCLCSVLHGAVAASEGEILRGQGAPETAAFVTSSPGGNGNGHGNGHGNSRSGVATAEANQAGLCPHSRRLWIQR